MQGGSLARNQEHPEDQRLVQVSLPQVRWREMRSEIAVSRDPSSDSTLSPATPTGLAVDTTRSQHLLRHPRYAAAPARRGWQRLPRRRDERWEPEGAAAPLAPVRPRGGSPGTSERRWQRLPSWRVSLAFGKKRKAGSLVGCIPLHQSSSPLVLQCRETQEEEECS